MFSEDFDQHKKNMDNLRLFAKELGKGTGEKVKGVGIPSFSVATKGKINFKAQAESLLGKRIDKNELKEKNELREKVEGLSASLQSMADGGTKSEAFSLPEELSIKKIKEQAQCFMLDLLTEEDFAVYLGKLEVTLSGEVQKYARAKMGLQEKKLVNEIIIKYEEALKELKLYLRDGRQKNFSNAIKLLSLAEGISKELEKLAPEKETSMAELEKPERKTSKYWTKKLPDASSLPPEITGGYSPVKAEYTTKKLPAMSNFSAPYSPPVMAGKNQQSQSYLKKPVHPSSNTFQSSGQRRTFSAGALQNGPSSSYMMSKPPPVWHSHYKAEGAGKLKGYDLAYLSPLFKNLTFKQLDEVAEKITLEKFERGYTLFKEREDGDKFYIIKTGKVTIYITKDTEESGKEIFTVAAGEVLGEISTMDRGAYAYSTKIYSEGTILATIQKDDFIYLADKYPWLIQNLNALSSQRLRDIYNKQ